MCPRLPPVTPSRRSGGRRTTEEWTYSTGTSYLSSIKQEWLRRYKVGKNEKTNSDEADALAVWYEDKNPESQSVQSGTIRNAIRKWKKEEEASIPR